LLNWLAIGFCPQPSDRITVKTIKYRFNMNAPNYNVLNSFVEILCGIYTLVPNENGPAGPFSFFNFINSCRT